MTAMLPAHLTESLNNLGDAAAALTAEVRMDREQRAAAEAAERARRRKAERWTMALLAAAVLLLAGLMWMGIQFEADRRARSATNAENLRRIEEISEQNTRIIRQVEDCTSVEGSCARRGQARYGSAIAELVRQQIVIEACGQVPGNDTVAEIQRCVAGRLAVN
jgi:hypothetical protein